MESLYRRVRPDSIGGLHGQPTVVKSVTNMLASETVPQVILLIGPSGTGKTTTARILKKGLGCSDRDFREINCAEARGIDTVREIEAEMRMSPWKGDCRVYLLDESSRLTVDAQSALLKILEDTPPNVYFMLATTDPQKLLPTIKTRCAKLEFKSLGAKELTSLLIESAKVATGDPEGDRCVSDEVVEKIVETADGSARMALVLLEQALTVADEEAQLEIVSSAAGKQAAVQVARMLLNKAAWKSVAHVLKGLDDDPEGVRRMILAYMNGVLLGCGKFAPRAAEVMGHFEYDLFATGKPGLSLACWRACGGK